MFSVKNFALPELFSDLIRIIVLSRILGTLLFTLEHRESISAWTVCVFFIYTIIYYLPIFISAKKLSLKNVLILLILFEESFALIKAPFGYWNLLNISNLNLVNSFGAQKMFLGKTIFLLPAYLVYYSRKRVPAYFKVRKRTIQITAKVLVTISVLSILYVLKSRGGIMGSIVAWSGGRHRALNETYHWFYAFFEVGKYLLVVLFIESRKKRYLFYALILVLGSLIIDGSRSSIVYLLLFALILSVKVRELIPISGLLFGVLLIPAFILFGSFRNNISSRGDINDFDLSGKNTKFIARSSEYAETKLWQFVPDRVGFLYGKTYEAALLNWIPRSLWANKPRGVGFYNASLILGKPGGGGVPVSQEAEIFWNFGVGGLLIFGTFYGLFWRMVSGLISNNLLWNNALAIFLILKFKWSTVLMVKIFQLILPILFIYLLINAGQRIIFTRST